MPMKIFQKGVLEAGLPGEVRITPEELEDLWHAYNLITVGDEVSSLAIRKVQRESSTGSVDSQRIKVNLTIQVTSIDFDPEGEELRLGGLVRSEIEGIRLGAAHLEAAVRDCTLDHKTGCLDGKWQQKVDIMQCHRADRSTRHLKVARAREDDAALHDVVGDESV